MMAGPPSQFNPNNWATGVKIAVTFLHKDRIVTVWCIQKQTKQLSSLVNIRINGQIQAQPTDKKGPEAPLRDGDGSMTGLVLTLSISNGHCCCGKLKANYFNGSLKPEAYLIVTSRH